MGKHLFNRIYCRCFQGAVKLGSYFMGYRMPQCLEETQGLRTLGAFLKEKSCNDLLVVTSAGMVRRGMVQPMLEGFDQAGIRYTLLPFDKPDPTSEDVERGYRAFREGGCRAIVALGGGSRIDCAKAIAARVARPGRSVAQLQGLLKVRRPIVPLIAISTTAGAGSETTVAAVIIDSVTHRKVAINDPVLIPHYAVLEPSLTVGLSPFVTATTGMDALTHAVEAYTNHTYNTALEDRLALEAVARIHRSLLTAFHNGSDLTARQDMQKAAFYAGRAFTRGCVGYVHAIGHTLGGLYGVPHGLAMAVLLPHVMRAYGSAVQGRLARLADACGMEGQNDAEKAERFLTWVEEANREMGLPDAFDMIRPEDVEQMVQWAMKEANPLYPVPVIWSREEFRALIQRISEKNE